MSRTVLASPVADAVWLKLGGVVDEEYVQGAVDLHRGRVTSARVSGQAKVVHPYAALYDTPGRRSAGRAGSTRDRFDGLFQVTCAGGDRDGALFAVDHVVARLSGVPLTLPGRNKPVRIVEDESNTVRTVLVDEDVKPPRYFVPLLFRLRV